MVDTFHALTLTQAAMDWKTTATRIHGCHPRMPPARPANSRARAGGVPGLGRRAARGVITGRDLEVVDTGGLVNGPYAG